MRTELAGADRLVVVFSDIEMGAGGAVDDFPHSDFLGELILRYNEPPYDHLAVDLVFNGDTFDLLKTSYLDQYPRHISADVALGKMSRVAGAHPRFFEAVRTFVRHGGARRDVYFVVGNHDFELLFPEVQALVRSLCGGSDRIHFPGFELDLGRVHLEHGSQEDSLFRMDPERLFVEHDGRTLLNIPWASVALLDVVMDLQPLLCFHERLVPRERVIALLPEVRQLLLERFWRYWTRDYWQGFFGSRDPVRRLNWTLLKEVSTRWFSESAEVDVGDAYVRRMASSDAYDLYLIGHLHDAGWFSYAARKTLQTGCMRNEYMVLDEGKTLLPKLKVYGEVLMRGERPIRSHLVEVEGPPPPAGYVPGDIFHVLVRVREMLAPTEERQQQSAQQRKLEAMEAKEGRAPGSAPSSAEDTSERKAG